MAVWITTAQLTDSTTLTISPSDHVWWNGATYGTNVPVGQYQTSTHIADDNDVHRCTSVHVNNTEYLDGTHTSINGGSSTSLPIPHASCSFLFTLTDDSAVQTSEASFYAYDGVSDDNPFLGITIQAVEGDVSTHWVGANGAGSALTLGDQTSNTTHNFYIGISLAPTSNGTKEGLIKLTLTYA